MNKSLVGTVILFLCACSGSVTHKLNFDPAEPLRVALIPFYEVDDDGGIVEKGPDLFLTRPSASQTKEQKEQETVPAEELQKLVASEVSKRTSFDLVPYSFVRAELVHRNLTKGRTFDYRRISKIPEKELCRILTCDAILWGRVKKWDQTYLGIQNVNSIAFDLQLVKASNGRKIFEVSVEDSQSQGITKGPTGYTSILLEPLKGYFDEEKVLDLARSSVVKAIKPISFKSRPEFLATPAPSIYASAHDSANGKVSAADPLVVMMFATSGRRAFFSIGEVIRNLPMAEVTSGHYLGIYFPLEVDQFQGQEITVGISDKFGRTTLQEVGTGAVSLEGHLEGQVVRSELSQR